MTTTATDFARILVSGLGALALTAGSFAFASAPARAAGAETVRVTVTVPAATGLVGAVRY